MDGQRFDDLTKELTGATPSRRRMLRGLAGGALAAVFGGRALGAAAQDVGTTATDAACEGQQVICNSAGEAGFQCSDGCVCGRNTNGDKQCVEALGATCTNRKRCDKNRDCGNGQVCIRVAGCTDDSCRRGNGRCFNRCRS